MSLSILNKCEEYLYGLIFENGELKHFDSPEYKWEEFVKFMINKFDDGYHDAAIIHAIYEMEDDLIQSGYIKY